MNHHAKLYERQQRLTRLARFEAWMERRHTAWVVVGWHCLVFGAVAVAVAARAIVGAYL